MLACLFIGDPFYSPTAHSLFDDGPLFDSGPFFIRHTLSIEKCRIIKMLKNVNRLPANILTHLPPIRNKVQRDIAVNAKIYLSGKINQ